MCFYWFKRNYKVRPDALDLKLPARIRSPTLSSRNSSLAVVYDQVRASARVTVPNKYSFRSAAILLGHFFILRFCILAGENFFFFFSLPCLSHGLGLLESLSSISLSSATFDSGEFSAAISSVTSSQAGALPRVSRTFFSTSYYLQ